MLCWSDLTLLFKQTSVPMYFAVSALLTDYGCKFDFVVAGNMFQSCFSVKLSDMSAHKCIHVNCNKRYLNHATGNSF